MSDNRSHGTSLNIVLFWAVVAMMTGKFHHLTDVQTVSVTEIKCLDTLDWKSRCINPSAVMSTLSVMIDDRTQNVRAKVLKNDDEWILQVLYLENCKVIDVSNWSCKENKSANKIREEWGSYNGTIYHMVLGGPPPDYYYSGVTGISSYLLSNGYLSMQSALNLDEFLAWI